MSFALRRFAARLVARKPSVAVSLSLSTVAALAVVAGFQAAGQADDAIPPEKEAALSTPSGTGSDPDDSTEGGSYPIVSPAPNSAPPDLAAEIPHIQNAALNGMNKYNEMQMLPVGVAERTAVAAEIDADMRAAIERGPEAFVNEVSPGGSRPDGSQAPQFRKDVVSALNPAFAMQEGLEISAQMLSVAGDASAPSLTSTHFVLDSWQGVTVTGRYTAKVVLLGSYETCFEGGVFAERTCQTDALNQWKLNMFKNLSDGKWRMTSRDGEAVDDAFAQLPTAPGPGPS
ncbi:hypothetical protein [Micromonospora humida]|uniref:hypothetical protein n=1 Tax=Micromonospora humida TaxID=2809018 RepID=UPI0034027C0A